MCSDNGNVTRKEIVLTKMEMADLEEENVKYQEKEKIIEAVAAKFSGTEYESMILEISDIIISSDKPNVLYVTSLKSFGKKDGIEVYRRIKDVAIN